MGNNSKLLTRRHKIVATVGRVAMLNFKDSARLSPLLPFVLALLIVPIKQGGIREIA